MTRIRSRRRATVFREVVGTKTDQFGMKGLGRQVNLAKVKVDREIPEQLFIWTTAEGLNVRLADMATPHLLNAIAKIRRGEALGKNTPNNVPKFIAEIEARPTCIFDGEYIHDLVNRRAVCAVTIIQDSITMNPMGDSYQEVMENVAWMRENRWAMLKAVKDFHRVDCGTLDSLRREVHPAVDIVRIRFAHDHYGEGKLKDLTLDDRDLHYAQHVPIYPYMILEAARRGYRVIE